jgi:hypothetical protein
MRIAVLVLGILGGIAAAFLGASWLSDYEDSRELIEAAQALGADASGLQSLVIAAYFLLSGLATGIAGGVLAFKHRGRVAAGLMLVSVVGAAIFAPKSLVFSCILALAAVFAFFVKPRAAVRVAQAA